MPSLALDPDLYLAAFVESVKDLFPGGDARPFLKQLRNAAMFGEANVATALANLQDWAGVNVSSASTASQFVRSMDLGTLATICQAAINQLTNEAAGITSTGAAYGSFSSQPSELG